MSFDPEPYAAGIRELNRRERERVEARLAEARREAGRLAEALYAADPGLKRVILFGSVAGGAPSREDFDIDLALEGGDLYMALDVVEDSPFKIDLVDLGRLPARMRGLVQARGIVLRRPD